jgi:hypothetical protein
MAKEQEELEQMVAGLSIATGPGVANQACLCGKLIPVVGNTRPWHSGIVNYNECLCADCRKEFADFARIVCLGCKSLHVFLQPQKARTGFEFLAKTHYHIDRCSSCDAAATSAPVLEHLRYCRDQGKPTNVDVDIVQEAEQKILQGAAAAATMRAELQGAFPTS